MNLQLLADMGRLNHDDGAESWAILPSLIETCKLSCIEQHAYLADVLTRLVNLWPNNRLDELLPWVWDPSRHHLARAAQHFHTTLPVAPKSRRKPKSGAASPVLEGCYRSKVGCPLSQPEYPRLPSVQFLLIWRITRAPTCSAIARRLSLIRFDPTTVALMTSRHR
jgi:hypothetical protein